MTVKKKATKKKATKKKSNAGRPSKFDEGDLKLMKYLYETGKTDKQVAEVLEVHEATLHRWKKANPEFRESLKDWKIEADKNVEKALFQRACGYDTKETKVFCDKNGTIKTHTVKKHYAPDATSMIFWLKNRQPDNWRDKQEIDLGNKEGESFSFGFKLDRKPDHRK